MSNAQLLFQRPELAERLAKQILVIGVGSAASSGVFLAAPRRTGKSTFVREDLRPALEAKGALVVYADLWANPTADPGNVIVNAIRASLASNDGVVLRLAKSAGMDKLSVGGVSFDLDRVGLGKDVSLTDALVALSGASSDRLVRLNGDLSQCKGLDGAAHTPPKPGSSLKGGVSNLELVF